MRKLDGQTVLLVAAIGGAVAIIGYFVADGQSNANGTARRVAVDGERAYRYLVEICDLGPRKSGSQGMLRQQQMLTEHFSQLGGQVSMQEFRVRHPEDGSPVTMRNIIVEWHPERQERILLCAHYDTRPFPDRDPHNPRGVFIGANDGASGVAVLCELAHYMHDLDIPYGVDFVLFDGEEFIFDERRDSDRYFMGSTYFSHMYVQDPPDHRYRWGVLLDMVGDAELQIYYERNSMRYARELTIDIWRTAARLGVNEFHPRIRHEIRDDHIPLNEIARIPSTVIIDFDYPRPGFRAPNYWHTEQDTPDKCSPDSLAKVGWVVLEWLRSQE